MRVKEGLLQNGSAKAHNDENIETIFAGTWTPDEQADAKAGPVSDEPIHEEIAKLAYSYWEERSRQNGSPEEDWPRAAGELRKR